MSNDNRAYVSGKFALDLDGKTAGWLYSVEGGTASADVVTDAHGPDHMKHRHLANVKYEPITIQCGTSISSDLQSWMLSSFHRIDGTHKDGHVRQESGAVIIADFNYRERLRQNFYGAIMTEISFPAADASSSDPAKMTVKFQPERTEIKQGNGEKLLAETHPLKQKRWLNRNFRFDIDGLALLNVNKVEQITFKQTLSEYPTGELRAPHREATSVEVPNISFSLPEANAKALFEWYDDFVVKGNCKVGNEKHGHLTFLHEDMHTEVCTLNFHGLGIFNMTLDKAEAMSDQIRRVKFDMYCEDIRVDFAKPGFGVSWGGKLLENQK